MNTPLIPFGTTVKVTAYYLRVMDGNKRTWKAIGFNHVGIVIGKRTLFNGTVNYYNSGGEPDFYGYSEWTAKEHFDAYLVAFPNRNPMYIPMDFIEVLK